MGDLLKIALFLLAAAGCLAMLASGLARQNESPGGSFTPRDELIRLNDD